MTTTKVLLRGMFRKYYQSTRPRPPTDIQRREFAFTFFGQKGMFRHRGMISADQYHAYLVKFAPEHAYVSAALYQKPEAPDMDAKGWMGCDFVFDIDCDHLPTDCKQVHDRWQCAACEFAGRGSPPPQCPGCGERKFASLNWVCDRCLGAAKEETLKLIEDFLEPDLGISKNEMTVAFSGHRGYHVHVETDEYRQLDQEQRRELVDYVRGTGVSLKVLGLYEDKENVHGVLRDAPGWGGKIARFLESFLEKATAEELAAVEGLSPRYARALHDVKREILGRIRSDNTNWTVRGVGMATFEKLAEHAVATIAPDVDVPVSLDVHRLIRLVDTLHGKTGLRVVEVPPNALAEFDPLKDALAFGTAEVTVKVTAKPFSPAFRISDASYPEFPDGTAVTLPADAAAFLLCKGAAEVP
ncbi:MAG: DNA primase small subunit PriS [Promethearchaeota archaeon]